MPLSVLIAEDHDITRQGLRTLLTSRLDASVVGMTGDGLQVVPLLKKYEPDLLVLDLGLPHLNGLDILRKIQNHNLSTEVIVLSMHDHDSYVLEAFQLGASGYVLKGSPLDELSEAVQTVVNGNRYLSSALPEELLCEQSASTSHPVQALTEREREVLQLTAEGYTSREIGEKLHISHRTVEKHRENIQTKLDLKNAVEMTSYAHQNGLLMNPPRLEEEA